MAAMNIIDGKFAMKSGVKDTLFGLIGSTKNYTLVRSLGGIVEHTPDGAKPTGIKKEKVADRTERHIGGKNATHIPGAHYSMIPYPGYFQSALGKKL